MISLTRRLYYWISCKWVLKTTRRYYEHRALTVDGELKEAIKKENCKALCWVSYSIKNLNNVKNMPDFLEQLTSISSRGFDSERQFYNAITELHAASFLSKLLGETVIEIESRSNKIKSPYSKQDKFCDLITATEAGKIYYEVKDASSEITTSYEKNGRTSFKPMDDEKIEQWIKNQTKEADRCGAQYLICRVPVWVDDVNNEEKDFYHIWSNRIFKNLFQVKRRVSKYEIVVNPNFSVSFHIKGIYLLKAFGYIKLTFQEGAAT